MKRNQNAERQKRRHACRQQMKEAGKSICPADTRDEVQPCVSSEQYQTREVWVWIPKRRAYEARIFEALPRRCNVQQHDVCVSSQRYETRVSTLERGTHEVHVSQMSPDKCDNQQREVRISYQ